MPTPREIFAKLDAALKADPSKVDGFDAVYQFNLGGDEPGTYQLILRQGAEAAVEGESETANCTLDISSSDFKDLLAGDLNGMQAFMSGKLRVQGDLSLAMRLESVLGAYTG